MSSASRTLAKRIRHAPFRRAPSCPFGLVPLRHDVICRLRRPFGGSHTALSGFVQVLRASLSPTRVSVVPNAVDTTVFTPGISRQDQAARPRWHAPFRQLRGPVLVVRRGMGPLLSGMGQQHGSAWLSASGSVDYRRHHTTRLPKGAVAQLSCERPLRAAQLRACRLPRRALRVRAHVHAGALQSRAHADAFACVIHPGSRDRRGSTCSWM